MPRFVDLSAPIAPSPEGTPEFLATGVDFFSHAAGAAEIEGLFGVPARLLRDGEGWTRETITNLGTHISTHVDAPYHYNSTIRGEPAQTIDQLPLEWFFAPGVVLDFTGRDDGDAVRVEDLEPALAAAGHELRERDIVLVRTDCDRFVVRRRRHDRAAPVSAVALDSDEQHLHRGRLDPGPRRRLPDELERVHDSDDPVPGARDSRHRLPRQR